MNISNYVVITPGTGDINFRAPVINQNTNQHTVNPQQSENQSNIIIKNIGLGYGLYYSRIGNMYEFKSLLAGKGLSISSSNDTITINLLEDYLSTAGGIMKNTLGLTCNNDTTPILSLYDTSGNVLSNLYYKDYQGTEGFTLTQYQNNVEETLFTITNSGGMIYVPMSVQMPDLTDNSLRIANTEFVNSRLEQVKKQIEDEFTDLTGNYIPLNFDSTTSVYMNNDLLSFRQHVTDTTPIGFDFGIDSDLDNSYINFTNKTGNSYDVRIIASGGTSGNVGQGTLNISAKNIYIPNPPDTDNSNQVATTSYVQDNLKNYAKESELSNYLTKTSAQSLYVPLSTTSYNLAVGNNGQYYYSITPEEAVVCTPNFDIKSNLITIETLPTKDPNVNGALWNDRGFVVVSGNDTDNRANKTANIVSFATTSPGSSEVLSMFISDYNYYIPNNFEYSYGSVDSAPSSPFVMTLVQYRNINYNNNQILVTVEVGTITIGIDKTITFATNKTIYQDQNGTWYSSQNGTGDRYIHKSDVLELVAPETTDNNIKNIVLNLSLFGNQ